MQSCFLAAPGLKLPAALMTSMILSCQLGGSCFRHILNQFSNKPSIEHCRDTSCKPGGVGTSMLRILGSLNLPGGSVGLSISSGVGFPQNSSDLIGVIRVAV